MRNKNNTRALQLDIARRLSKSELWIVLRLDDKGIHAHMPNTEHLCLLGAFFDGRPDLLEIVNEYCKHK